jgi:hypothetical protein
MKAVKMSARPRRALFLLLVVEGACLRRRVQAYSCDCALLLQNASEYNGLRQLGRGEALCAAPAVAVRVRVR